MVVPGGMAASSTRSDFAADDLNVGSGFFFRGAGFDLQARDGGDGRQRFSAKAEGGDREQVVVERILEVAWRSKARRASSLTMPWPLSAI